MTALQQVGQSIHHFPQWRMPLRTDGSSFSLAGDEGLDAILRHLDASGHNWYWDALDDASKARVRERLAHLRSVIPYIMTRLQALGYPPAISVIVQGSYLWGAEAGRPADLDVTVVVPGNELKTWQFPLEDMKGVFPADLVRQPAVLSVQAMGTEWVTSAQGGRRGLDHALSLGLSLWGSGVVVDGVDHFAFAREAVPVRALLVKASNLVTSAWDHFTKEQTPKGMKRLI
jgi:hypothetical protein